MKSKIKNVVSCFIVFCISIFVMYEIFTFTDFIQRFSSKQPILDLEVSDIAEVELKSSSNFFRLKKINRMWTIIKPVDFLADHDFVTQWIEKMLNENGEAFKSNESNPIQIDWSLYSFDSPKASLTIKTIHGKVLTLDLSSHLGLKSTRFLRLTVGSNQQLFSGTKKWDSLISRNLRELENKTLFSWNYSQWQNLDKVLFSTPENSVLFESKKGLWLSTSQKTKGWASNEYLRFLDKLSKFEMGPALTHANSQTIRHHSQPLKIEVEFKDATLEKQVISFFPISPTDPNSEHFVHNSVTDRWYSLSAGSVKELFP